MRALRLIDSISRSSWKRGRNVEEFGDFYLERS